MQGKSQDALSDIPLVTITTKGIFKYITIEATIDNKGQKTSKRFVRGDDKLEYHDHNFDNFAEEVKKKSFEIRKRNIQGGNFQAAKGDIHVRFVCLGGGRIQHNYKGKKCHIYGYSVSFGRIDHGIAQQMISTALGYPLNQITTSQEGY